MVIRLQGRRRSDAATSSRFVAVVSVAQHLGGVAVVDDDRHVGDLGLRLPDARVADRFFVVRKILFVARKICRRIGHVSHLVGLEGIDGHGEDGDGQRGRHEPEPVPVVLVRVTVSVASSRVLTSIAETKNA